MADKQAREDLDQDESQNGADGGDRSPSRGTDKQGKPLSGGCDCGCRLVVAAGRVRRTRRALPTRKAWLGIPELQTRSAVSAPNGSTVAYWR
jgi:hypothetical protein